MTFQETLDLHITAIQNRDLSRFLSTLSATGDLNIIFPNGIRLREYNEIVDFHRDWFDDPDWSLHADLLALQESAAMASALLLITYDDVDEEGEAYQLTYYLNLLFALRESQWLLVHDQNTLVKFADDDPLSD